MNNDKTVKKYIGLTTEQLGDIGEYLALYILGEEKNLSVARVDHVGADLFVYDPKDSNKRYAVSVKCKHGEGYNFEESDIKKLINTANLYNLEPAISLIFIDNQEEVKKIRFFFSTLYNLKELCKIEEATFIHGETDDNDELRWFKFNIKETSRSKYLSENFKYDSLNKWSDYIDYEEISLNISSPSIPTSSIETSPIQQFIIESDKDGRVSKQYGDFAEHFAMHILGQYKKMSVAYVDHVGADIFAASLKEKEKIYAISVKGRVFPVPPKKEGKSVVLKYDHINKLKMTSDSFGYEPAVIFVFTDDMEDKKKIRMFFVTIDNLYKLCDMPDANFIVKAEHGINFKYEENKVNCKIK